MLYHTIFLPHASPQGQTKGKASFCEQKEAKKLFMLGHGRWRRHCPWPGIEEVFAPLFSKSGRFLAMTRRRY
jgi:hypothetical protein